jgi:hypothetical protein
MQFIQLNNGWNAEPNAPEVDIKIQDNKVIVSFYLNAFIFKDFDEDDKGILTFQDCIQYRYGSPNDEGFYCFGQSRYKDFGVKWGEFYEVNDSDWKTNFPDVILMKNHIDNNKEYKHYLFYFKDGTFECIACDYDLKFLNKPIELFN